MNTANNFLLSLKRCARVKTILTKPPILQPKRFNRFLPFGHNSFNVAFPRFYPLAFLHWLHLLGGFLEFVFFWKLHLRIMQRFLVHFILTFNQLKLRNQILISFRKQFNLIPWPNQFHPHLVILIFKSLSRVSMINQWTISSGNSIITKAWVRSRSAWVDNSYNKSWHTTGCYTESPFRINKSGT